MRCRSPKAHWTFIGGSAARLGHTLGQALTNNARVDEWITAGFKAAQRKIDRRTRMQLGSAETFALVKSKLGI
jgi:hypothetical protein